MKHSKLSNRLVHSYSLVFAILLLIIMAVSYVYISNTGRHIAMLNQKELAEQALKRVEALISEIEGKSYQVMTDSRIINVFGKIKDDGSPENYFETNILAGIDTASVLASINGPARSLWRISVYNQYGDYISSGAFVGQKNVKENLSAKNVGEEMVALRYTPERIKIIKPEEDIWSDIHSSLYVTVKRPLMNIYSKEVLGIVEVQQDISVLKQTLIFETLKDVHVKLYDNEGNQLLPQSRVDEKKLHTSYAVSEKYGWIVGIGQTESELLKPYQSIKIMLGIGYLAVLLLVILSVLFIARRLSKPLVLLADTVGMININTLPETLPVDEGIEEVNSLKVAFANMIARINESIIHERRAWLLALQSQMNPHFLYNMLSVISSAALESGNDKIMDMCQRMSSMFRYVANYDETTVTVQAELEHVSNYLELMKERYEDYFDFEIDADDKIRQMLVPKLVLQPIAENCFIHGFKDIEPPYFIRIEAVADSYEWTIRIIDNGSGIDDKKKGILIKKINQYQRQYQNSLPENYASMKIGGMGLVSTILRFKLQNSGGIEYSIEDNNPVGTIISIRGEFA